MFVQAKHPTSAVTQLVDVVSVDRAAKIAHCRPADKLSIIAREKAGKTNETAPVPFAWLTWIPCGP